MSVIPYEVNLPCCKIKLFLHFQTCPHSYPKCLLYSLQIVGWFSLELQNSKKGPSPLSKHRATWRGNAAIWQRRSWEYMSHIQELSDSWAGFWTLKLVDCKQFNLGLREQRSPKCYLKTQAEITLLWLKLGGASALPEWPPLCPNIASESPHRSSDSTDIELSSTEEHTEKKDTVPQQTAKWILFNFSLTSAFKTVINF